MADDEDEGKQLVEEATEEVFEISDSEGERNDSGKNCKAQIANEYAARKKVHNNAGFGSAIKQTPQKKRKKAVSIMMPKKLKKKPVIKEEPSRNIVRAPTRGHTGEREDDTKFTFNQWPTKKVRLQFYIEAETEILDRIKKE